MNKHLLIPCAALAIASFGGTAIAQTAPANAMHVAVSTMPTMVCRAVNKGETATATLAAGGGIVCKPVDMSKIMKDPTTPAGASKADEDAAWQRQLQFLMMEST